MKISQTTKNPEAARTSDARPTAKSKDTRARLIRGAIRVLEEHGVGEATTRRIAAAADVRLATLHYHFDSKESLLLAVLETLNADLAAAGFGDMPQDMPLEARMEKLIRASWQHAARTRRAQIAQIELTLHALRSDETAWLAVRQYQSYVAVYATELVGSIERPPDEAERVAASLSRFILCGIDGLILQSFALRDDHLAQTGIDALVEAARHHLRGLLAGPTKG